ncbi:aminotransferase family protein [Bacillus toyonensis]|uniref:Aspartate aminotransferase family protein n=1 Tax=Bacillus toyonensis TaxID=155322 RepID=A0A2A8HD42_9BACI|nr:aminotransferase class III-fold pyridoxal phosphate-dependent enzyme [Bacillus toyonensis]PEQ03366.1 aspartate aminotransferase family protein [Bacillus toyonensis]
MQEEKQINNHPVVHPHYNVVDGEDFPNLIQGEGIYVKDTFGNIYMDGISGLWNVSLGYNNSRINQAIYEQLQKIPYINLGEYQNSTTIELAQKILGLLPNSFKKLIYTSSGSESVELAVKIARQYQHLKGKKQKKDFVVLENSYHGAYYASMSASGTYQDVFEIFQPIVSGFHFLKSPFKCNIEQVLEETEKFIDKNYESLAGIILEPVIGSGGIITLPQEYIELVEKKCKQYDILLIFDEVATGFGRTGKMFAFEHFGIEPDIICFSKGINSGYLPLAALVFNTRVNNLFLKTKSPINHLSTQNGNPIACAAGIATIDELVENNIIEEVQQKGKKLIGYLQKHLKKYNVVADIRGEGLMVGIELRRNNSTFEYKEIKRLIKTARKKGLIIYGFYSESYTSGLSLFPPFIISEAEIGKMVKIIEGLIKQSI